MQPPINFRLSRNGSEIFQGSWADVCELVKGGGVQASDMYWQDDFDDWKPADELVQRVEKFEEGNKRANFSIKAGGGCLIAAVIAIGLILLFFLMMVSSQGEHWIKGH